jgi:hypothetical protein
MIAITHLFTYFTIAGLAEKRKYELAPATGSLDWTPV